MTRIFGTDGLRGRANIHPMTVETAMKLGKAIVTVMPKQGQRFKALIGKDPRLSGYMFECAIASGINAMGGDVLFTGPLPTPAISHLAVHMRCDVGIMISASHNPFTDNGIKIFAADGFKLPDAKEDELEACLHGDLVSQCAPENIGRNRRIDDALGRYIAFLKNIFPRRFSLEGLKIVVDCANGAAYKIAPTVLWELGAEIVETGCEPNGFNINEGVGALHPEHCAKLVLEHKADLGVTLDGDADRLILVDEKGQIVDGDVAMALIAVKLKEEGKLSQNTIVTTVMSNLGLELALREYGISCVKTQVGDRYVVEAMRRENLVFGGEQSGHMVCFEHATTGDGLIAALEILSVLVEKKKTLSELAKIVEKLPQVLVNFPVPAKPKLEDLRLSQELIDKISHKFGEKGRVLVRYSGTEPKCRVMIEGPDENEIRRDADAIAALIRVEIAESIAH